MPLILLSGSLGWGNQIKIAMQASKPLIFSRCSMQTFKGQSVNAATSEASGALSLIMKERCLRFHFVSSATSKDDQRVSARTAAGLKAPDFKNSEVANRRPIADAAARCHQSGYY